MTCVLICLYLLKRMHTLPGIGADFRFGFPVAQWPVLYLLGLLGWAVIHFNLESATLPLQTREIQKMGHLNYYPGVQDVLFDHVRCRSDSTFPRLYPSWYEYQLKSYEERRFNELSNTEKLGKAIFYATTLVPGEAGYKLFEFMNPANLALTAGTLGVLVGVQFVPVGWVVDLAMVGMAGVAALAVGADVVAVVQELFFFTRAVVDAQDETQLRTSSQHLARAIAIAGVDVVLAILLKKTIFRSKDMAGPKSEAPPTAPSVSRKWPALPRQKSPPPQNLPVIEPKIQGQMESRGWTVDSVHSTVANSEKKIPTKDTRFDPVTGMRRNDPATAYVNSDGSYVVVNNNNGTIVQVSNRKDPNWKAPW